MRVGVSAVILILLFTVVGCGGGSNSTGNNGGNGGSGGGGTNAAPLAYVYVASANPNGNVATFSLSSTGTLTSAGTIAVSPDPRFIALARTGSLLLVPAITDGSMAILNSGATGTLSANARVTGISQPLEVEADPNGNFAYVLKLGGGIDVYSLNATGAATFASTVTTPSGTVTRLAFDSTGSFVYLGISGGTSATSGIQTYSVNATTGALTPAGFQALTGIPANLLVANSRLFVVFPDPTSDQVASHVQVFPIQANGLPGVSVANVIAGGNASSLAIIPNGTVLYVGNNGTNNVSGYQVAASGALTPIAGLPAAAGNHVSDLAIDPSGAFLIASNTFGNSVQVFGIAANGALTLVNAATITEPISLAVVHK
jgi:6-phosphogluconolactonase (cycloisomerase 2 family)